MNKILKKSLLALALVSFTVSLSACQTTKNERIAIGTLLGAGIGAGIGAASDGRAVAGGAIGASTGAVLGAFYD